MTILVTGGAGFIGSHFVKYVHEKDPSTRMVILDALTYAGNIKNLDEVMGLPGISFIHGSIADLDMVTRLMDEYHPEVIVNFAAETHVDRSIHKSASDFVETNVRGVQVLLDAARVHRVSKFIQISTDEVYGALPLSAHERFTEDSPFKPNSPYAASKAAGDLLCRSYFVTYGVPTIVTHGANNYGSHQFPEKMIPFWILELLEGKKIPLYGDGLYVRDWIHVADHVAAIWDILQKGTPGEVYNIGVGNELANRDIATLLLEEIGLPSDKIRTVADRPGHDRRYAIDASKLFREMGFVPLYPRARFREGLRETLAWYRTHIGLVKELAALHGPFNPHIPQEPKATVFVFGSGLLGSAYRSFFARNNYTVVGDRVDVRDAAAVRAALTSAKPQLVINCVAKTDIDWCERNKAETMAVNVVGADNVAAACAELGVYLVHISSGCVQASTSAADAHCETDPATPVCFYAWTKVFADTLIEYRAKHNGLQALILRPRQLLSAELSPRNALAKMLTYKKFIDTDNSCTIVPDLLSVTEKLIEKRATGIFNIVNPGVTSPYKIALKLREMIKPEMEITKISKEELNAMTFAERIDAVLTTTKLESLGITLPPIETRLTEIILELKKNLDSNRGSEVMQQVASDTAQKLTLKVPSPVLFSQSS